MLTILHTFARGSIIPGPLTVRQKCCDGSEKKSSWKRTSPQIWQRWAAVSGILLDRALCFGYKRCDSDAVGWRRQIVQLLATVLDGEMASGLEDVVMYLLTQVI